MDTKTVTPVVAIAASKKFDDTDLNVYLPVVIENMITVGFSLQTSYENVSEFQREFITDGVTLALKYLCTQTISKWDNTVTRAGKMKKYQHLGRPDVAIELEKRAEFRKMAAQARNAEAIKAKL